MSIFSNALDVLRDPKLKKFISIDRRRRSRRPKTISNGVLKKKRKLEGHFLIKL